MSLLRLKNNKENVLILNTPNRQEILKDGPPLGQVRSNLLGRGAYGTVIKAIYKAKPVALKIIKNLKDVNKQMLQNESRILGWRHSNIVKILKIESTANFAIVIMERFDGQCLQSLLDSTQIALGHRVNIALDIIAALSFCHKKLILHMDVKPQNCMVFLNNRQPLKATTNSVLRLYTCKLCDFGSSIDLNEDKYKVKGLVKGTLRYMAPEALKEECLTPAADIYSLGITLWQMKHRRFPYNWLECNEVVAYQVVKHNLRPNALEPFRGGIVLAQKSSQMPKCEYHPISSHMSAQSFENLLNILNENECKVIENQWEKENSQPLSICKKPPLSNNSSNAKRKLQFDFIMNEPCALASILQKQQSSSQRLADRAEDLYEDIFISCWHSDYKQRPSTSKLYQMFNKLL